MMFVDGKPIPFSYNSTITYTPEDKQNGPLYNKVIVTAVDVSHPRRTDALKVDSTASVDKGLYWSRVASPVEIRVC